MRAVCVTLLATCAAGMAVHVTAAPAATVTVTLDAQFRSFNEVRYVAAPGEVNDLTADYAADATSVTVTDPGAVITARGSCRSLSRHSAVCTAPDPPFPVAGPFLQSVRALLGDRDDRAVTTRTGPNVIGGIDAFGGSGDDVLTGSPTDDVLDGGGGTDVLIGGRGGDRLSDGDVDGAAADLAPNADTLDGGPGLDRLSYAQRTRGVVVDLARNGPAGKPGENDVARSFEWATGGKGDDRLAGDDGPNDIDGGGGSDQLTGRGGNDILRNASGRKLSCGQGRDAVTRPRARTRIAASCESLSIRLPRGARADSGATMRPTPRSHHGDLGFDVTCPDLDGEPADCRATLRIRTSTGRLLATGRLDRRGDSRRVMHLRLTALGRSLRRDGRKQFATTVLRGPLMRKTAWTIRF
jgi:Ca2+-binding RTX toxin-like protein